MPYLESEGQRLLAALKPLVAFAERTRRTLDPTDPKAGGRFRLVREVETALNAAADYAKAADGLLNPAPSPLVSRVRNLLAFYDDPAPLTAGKLTTYFPLLPRSPDGLR